MVRIEKHRLKNIVYVVTCVTIGLVAVVLLLNLLGGRSKAGEMVSTNIHRGFDAQATIMVEDVVMLCDINKTVLGDMTISVIEPDTLNGLTIAYNGDDITTSYKGMSFTMDDSSVVATSIGKIILSAINKASSPSGVEVKMLDSSIVIDGETDQGRFSITLDKNNGNIVSLNVPNLDFICNFDEFLWIGQ